MSEYSICARCGSFDEQGFSEGTFQVSVETGVFNSSGGQSDRVVSFSGLCEECSGQIFETLSGALKEEIDRVQGRVTEAAGKPFA